MFFLLRPSVCCCASECVCVLVCASVVLCHSHHSAALPCPLRLPAPLYIYFRFIVMSSKKIAQPELPSPWPPPLPLPACLPALHYCLCACGVFGVFVRHTRIWYAVCV